MTDVMIDLETMSTRAHAVILTIGAIRFDRLKNILDPRGDYKSTEHFYIRIKPESCTRVGMHWSGDTEKWWHRQDKDAKDEAMFNFEREELKEGLKKLTKFFRGSRYVWGNGCNFDITILDEAYKRCNMLPPWKFWNVRDVRTIYDIGGIKNSDTPDNGKHHALHDCYRQIIGVQMAYERIAVS